MGAYVRYLELELKRMLKTLPRFITGAIVLVCLLGTIAFSTSKIMYGNAVINRIQVGVVLPEDDVLAQKVIQMVTSLDSVKSVCDFVYLDEIEGRMQVEGGSLHALMLIPDGLIRDIMVGVNTPIVVILSERPGIEVMVFKELADAGARTLSVAQASIYAADELCIEYQMPGAISQVEDHLNQTYFAYSLPREEYYRDYQVLATTDVSVEQYYGISAAILCLFLCGIPLAVFCKPEKMVLQQKLELIGIGKSKQILAKILSVTLLLTIFLGMLAGGLVLMDMIIWKPILLLVMLVVCLVTAAIIVTVYTIVDSSLVGVMCLFWMTIIMLFLSGGLIPSVFLPESLRQMANVVPVTPLIDLLKMFVGVEISWLSMVKAIMWGIGFYLAALQIWKRR